MLENEVEKNSYTVEAILSEKFLKVVRTSCEKLLEKLQKVVRKLGEQLSEKVVEQLSEKVF